MNFNDVYNNEEEFTTIGVGGGLYYLDGGNSDISEDGITLHFNYTNCLNRELDIADGLTLTFEDAIKFANYILHHIEVMKGN